MLLNDIITAIEAIAPPHLAADWDNVGLLIGSQQWHAERIMLTIDLTQPVLQEAIDSGAKLIISYHPPIFHPLKSVTDASPTSRLVLEAAAAHIAVYSPHTALDAAQGGINDWLTQALGAGDSRALESHILLPETEQCKIVTFAPAEAVDRIRNGLAASGAGRIGKYTLCSFELPGRGTFFAGDGTNPKVGSRGSLQYVDEVRLEMVCANATLPLIIATLREFHPYEEPAFEIFPLQGRPQRHVGQGRRITLDQPATLNALADRIKQHLNVKRVEAIVGDNAPSKYTRIGLCAGAGGSMLQQAIDQGCHLFFTGEMRHHDMLAAQAQGCTVILAGHTNTERGYLKVLRKKMLELLPNVDVAVSKRDVNPVRVI